jgi:hypothetical protein
MRIIQLGTILGVLSLLATALAVYKDREYIPQLACSVIGLAGEISYCREFVATTNGEDELAIRRKRQAEEAEQRRKGDAPLHPPPTSSQQQRDVPLPQPPSQPSGVQTYGSGSPIISNVGGNVDIKINQ